MPSKLGFYLLLLANRLVARSIGVCLRHACPRYNILHFIFTCDGNTTYLTCSSYASERLVKHHNDSHPQSSHADNGPLGTSSWRHARQFSGSTVSWTHCPRPRRHDPDGQDARVKTGLPTALSPCLHRHPPGRLGGAFDVSLFPLRIGIRTHEYTHTHIYI